LPKVMREPLGISTNRGTCSPSEPVRRTSELQELGSIFPISIVAIGGIAIQPSWIIIAMGGFLSMKELGG